ncbi:MAG: bifunctional homocysteine S-methyltransferase/methylenetetrahydrofolate reductase [candidate division Zixibacteria bacterium]|nr:bifunctional homocysteine S-methyltransferase/methylenetetrahydrofolate reductase [candidate division Zixibacteria bacterium]
MDDSFLKALSERVLICDGAMGTLLHLYGIPFNQCFDELNLSLPGVVGNIHRDYIAAGADIIETNTFGGNRARLAKYGYEKKVKEINRAGARIAREAQEISGEFVWIAGSIGPLGKALKPIGKVDPDDTEGYFSEQVEALLEGGVDLFVVETFSDIHELESAINAIKRVCDKPIIASSSFNEELRTFMGYSPADVVHLMEDAGADIIGANCSVGPQQMAEVLDIISHTTKKPLSVMPNAGLPKFVDGRFVYLSSPEYFAQYTKAFIQYIGARIVGGCCGTTPEHIKAIKQTVDTMDGIKEERRAQPRIRITEDWHVEEDYSDSDDKYSDLSSRLGKEFLISTEIDPPKGWNPTKIIKGAELLKEAGSDIVNIADSPMARVRMSAITAAYLIKQTTGLEVILHLTARDRNLMGLQSDLLGCHALGIRNILAVTGDPPTVGDYPDATGVYDVDSIGLTAIINKMNTGTDFAGNPIGKPTRFTVGVGINPVSDDINKEVERFHKKIEAGAKYAFTQPLYELEPLLKFMDLVQMPEIPVFLGILPLQSSKHALFLHNEVPGIFIPERFIDKMEKAKNEGGEIGIEIAMELLQKTVGLTAGIYFMPSFGRYSQIAEVIKLAKPMLSSTVKHH